MNELILKLGEFFVPAIFVLILKDFFDLFLSNRRSAKLEQYSVWLLYFLIDRVISIKAEFNGIYNISYTFLLLSVFCLIVYKNDIKYILLIVSFLICIGTISELVVALGVRIFLNNIQLQYLSIFGSTCSKIIILVIIRILKIFKTSGVKQLDFWNWLTSILISGGSLYIIYNLYLLSLNSSLLLESIISAVIILSLDVICFKMFDKITAEEEIKRKNDIYKQSIEIYRRGIEEREEYSERIRKFRHNMKNHFIVMERLTQAKEYERLQEYLEQFSRSNDIFNTKVISGNSLIDALLHNKFEVASKYNIDVDYDIEIPVKLQFEDVDLCIIVGNALDNAIDAAKRVLEKAYIYIEMKFKQGNLVFKIINSFDGTLEYDKTGKNLKTRKKDKENHGLGLGLIEETAQKYNGLVELKITEKEFIISVLLYQL